MTSQKDNKDETRGTWMTLMDYAMKNDISLSTLRRHIKARKLTFKIEDGRYLVWDKGPTSASNERLDDISTLQSRLQRLTQDLNSAREEIAELKTLIALYEEKIPHQRLNN